MTGPSWQIPNEDAAQAFEDEERHRYVFGFCAHACAHEECHQALGDETYDDGNEDEEDE